jgi:hypothetical protein
MDAKKYLLVQTGKVKKTTLDKAYKKHIVNTQLSFDEEEDERWETYNLIVNSLIKNDDYNYIAEMKYRVTDGENLNEVLLNFIERNVLDVDGLMWLLKRRIEGYLEDDFIKRFYV